MNDGSQAQLEDPGVADPIANDPELQKALVALVQHFAGLEKYGRRTEVMDCRRQRFYRRQDQYIVWNTAQYLFGPWPGNTSDTPGPSPAQDSPRYTDVYDIFWPYLRIIISVGTQNPPGVNFEPDDPTKAPDIAAARAAEKYRHFVDRVNKRKDLQGDVMSKFGTDGRTVLYTRPVANEQKYGVDENGKPNIYPLASSPPGAFSESKVVPITAKSPGRIDLRVPSRTSLRSTWPRRSIPSMPAKSRKASPVSASRRMSATLESVFSRVRNFYNRPEMRMHTSPQDIEFFSALLRLSTRPMQSATNLKPLFPRAARSGSVETPTAGR